MNCKPTIQAGRIVCSRCGREFPPSIPQSMLQIPCGQIQSPAQTFDCIYRGEIIRQQECRPCRATGKTRIVDVHRCEKFGQCTIHSAGIREATDASPLVKVCVSCPDRTEELFGLHEDDNLPRPELTIGIPVYDDPIGAAFTINSIRLHHPEVMDICEIILADNHPLSREGQWEAKFVWKMDDPRIRYLQYAQKTGTAPIRDFIISKARAPYFLIMDSHVLVEAGAISRFLDTAKKMPEGDIFHGPMLSSTLRAAATNMIPTFRAGMCGRWAFDSRGQSRSSQPFVVDQHNMGLFGGRTDTWVGFNPHMRGFGVEGYIHRKLKKMGRKAWVLPFLRWWHLFDDDKNPILSKPYPRNPNDAMWNYIVGWLELGEDLSEVKNHFVGELGRSEQIFEEFVAQAKKLYPQPRTFEMAR